MAVSSSRIPSFNSNSVISAARTHRAYKPENPFKVASRAEKQFRVSRLVKVRAFGPPNALKEYKLAKVCRLARTSARAKAPRWSAPKEYNQFRPASPLANAYRVAARSRKKVRTDLPQDATAQGPREKAGVSSFFPRPRAVCRPFAGHLATFPHLSHTCHGLCEETLSGRRRRALDPLEEAKRKATDDVYKSTMEK